MDNELEPICIVVPGVCYYQFSPKEHFASVLAAKQHSQIVSCVRFIVAAWLQLLWYRSSNVTVHDKFGPWVSKSGTHGRVLDIVA
jgi:hypothetical protein